MLTALLLWMLTWSKRSRLYFFLIYTTRIKSTKTNSNSTLLTKLFLFHWHSNNYEYDIACIMTILVEIDHQFTELGKYSWFVNCDTYELYLLCSIRKLLYMYCTIDKEFKIDLYSHGFTLILYSIETISFLLYAYSAS